MMLDYGAAARTFVRAYLWAFPIYLALSFLL